MTKMTLYWALAFVSLIITSLLVGTITLDSANFDWLLLSQTRIPRTIAIILSGMSLSVAGVIMQMLANNKFVEPTTTGTVEWAILGMLLLLIFYPQASLTVKLSVSVLFSIVGAVSFLLLIKKLHTRSVIMVPLVGIIYAGIIGAVVNFIAYQQDLMQFVWVWIQGDFSMILQGRYELLWIAGLLTFLAYFIADRFTLVGLGKNVATNLGLNYSYVFAIGITLVASIAGITVVIAGVLPFLGLIVPNIVSLYFGDNLRRSIPLIACLGAMLALVCDILARILVHPFEIPVGVIMGVVGSVVFLGLLLRQTRHD
ncbi:MAG: iron chelate uptake ABC transporter family permease subunit [Paraglaciecola sp.]|uniref:ABC transporter permease n=1 Tax=Paraglaciecola sp. TaxID=1920173 RepID=UPI003298CE4A